MVDFSRAEASRNHRTSFDSTANNIITYIDGLKSSYETTWEELEKYRKERAAFIENIIQIIKSNKAKTTLPLGRCNNEELNEELNSVIDTFEFGAREEIMLYLVKINNRYYEIVRLGAKLEDLAEQISAYRVLENDNDKEVVIDMSIYKKQKEEVPKEEPKKETTDNPGLVRVIKITEASPELIASLEEKLASRRIVNVDTVLSAASDVEMPSLIESEDLLDRKDFNIDGNVTSPIEDELTSLYSEDANDEDKINEYIASFSDDDEDEYIPYTFHDGVTLIEIAERVYDDPDLWKELYRYGTNKNKIDRVAAEYKMSVEKIAKSPNCLENVTLQIPTELVTYTEVPTSSLKKSA